MIKNLMLPIDTIKIRIQQAYKRYTRLKANPKQRDSWLVELIQAKAEAMNTKATTLWKQLHSSERIRNNAQMVKKALMDMTLRNGLSSVIAPLPEQPGSKYETSTKAELELACLVETG